MQAGQRPSSKTVTLTLGTIGAGVFELDTPRSTKLSSGSNSTVTLLKAIWFEGQGRDTHDAQKRQQLEHSHEHSHGLSGNERQALNLLGCPLSLVASIEVHSL